MARSTIDRVGDDIGEKFELFQEWWRAASKELPSAKELRSYLPQRKQKRSIALPVALVIGGLALVGAITLLSTTPIRSFKGVGRAVSSRKTASEGSNETSNEVKSASASTIAPTPENNAKNE